MQTPSIGRIVQYQRPGSADGKHKSEVSPAIITQVFDNDDCQLTIFNPNGMYMARVPYAGDGQIKPSHWHWPSFTPAPAPSVTKVAFTNFAESVYENIAKICHQANKAFFEIHNDFSQVDWEKATSDIKQSAIDGVIFIFDNPNAGDSALHDNWMNFKLADGWVLGKVKDAEKKTHPCLVPFEELPIHQQQKDRIFRAIVKSFID